MEECHQKNCSNLYFQSMPKCLCYNTEQLRLMTCTHSIIYSIFNTVSKLICDHSISFIHFPTLFSKCIFIHKLEISA